MELNGRRKNKMKMRNFAAEIYFEISNKILVRNSKRRKVLDCLKKLNLEYNYTSYVTDFDEINTMLEVLKLLLDLIRNNWNMVLRKII